MKIILASSNTGKIKEIQEYCIHSKVLPYSEIIEKFEIIEDGKSYQENAYIKARAIYEKIKDREKDFVILADDSGISLPNFDNIPGIYSARFAGEGASDKDNLYKLIELLKESQLKTTPAYYTAAMALVTENGNEFSVHGWMHGDVIDEEKGEKGFGYDPMFIPLGYDKTLGQLDGQIKKKLSHRSKALKLVAKILKTL